MSDRERQAVQEKDRLRRKLQEDIYNTKMDMLQHVEEVSAPHMPLYSPSFGDTSCTV